MIGELATVRFFVAGFAGHRRPFELDLFLSRQHFVAFSTRHGAVRSDQREFGFRVVEPIHVRPGFCAVASLAPERGSIGPAALHAVAKLPIMRILVTCGAIAVLKMERENLIRSARCARHMAFGAGDGNVRARQRVACVAMFQNGEESAVPVRHGVARLAAVLIGLSRKLAVVRIFMAIGTIRESDFVDCFFSRWKMALRTFHGHMLPFQGIFRRSMFFHTK